jgi:hypothetical protein
MSATFFITKPCARLTPRSNRRDKENVARDQKKIEHQDSRKQAIEH